MGGVRDLGRVAAVVGRVGAAKKNNDSLYVLRKYFSVDVIIFTWRYLCTLVFPLTRCHWSDTASWQPPA